MSVLLQNVTNSIWHAFSSLQNGEFKVNKSKLKVLTANLGTLLDLYGVEKGLDHYRSTTELNFEHFTYYLQNEVFASLPDVMPLPELREYEAKISEVCWLICRKKYLKRDRAVFTDESVFQLFRIFCVLSDLVLDDDKPECYQVLIHASEACSLSEQLVRAVGQSWDAAEWDALCGAAPLAWGSLLALLERKYCHHAAVDPPALAEAVEEMYEVYVEDVVMKGYLMKRGYLLGALREYWCVARPCSLAYYRSAGAAAAGRTPAGRVPLDAHCRVQRAPAALDNARFHLVTGERTFEFAAQDHKSRLQWMAALRRAVAASGGDGRRGGERARDAARARLQEERRARIAAETQAQELAVMAEEGGRKVLELQNAQLALEKLLEEETQAKKDEEIVRALQARVLAEEWEKREELEKLQEQQLKMLEEERSKRRHYEHMQVEKEIQYREAAERLKQLELERQALDEELRLAQNKIRVAELHAETIGTRLQDMNHNTRHGDRMRKAFSFVPTSKSSSDTHLQLRASSMRRNAELNNNGFVEKRL